MRHTQDYPFFVGCGSLGNPCHDASAYRRKRIRRAERGRVVGEEAEDLRRFVSDGEPRLPLPVGPEGPLEETIVRKNPQTVRARQRGGCLLRALEGARVDGNHVRVCELSSQRPGCIRPTSGKMESGKSRVDDVVRVLHFAVADAENPDRQGYPTGPMSLPIPTSIPGTRKSVATNM